MCLCIHNIFKKILSCVLVILVSSCVKNEIYCSYGDYEIQIIPEITYDYKLGDDFIYRWDEFAWGNIGYKIHDTIYEDIYVNNEFIICKPAYKSPINILTSDIVDCVISTYDLQNLNHTYLISTDKKEGSVFSFLNQYPIYEQPEEIWSSTIDNMNCNIRGYDWDINEEGYHSRKIYSKLSPQSFIYVIQIIIHNDSKDGTWGPMGLDSLILSGMSNTRNIKTQKSLNDQCNIFGDIKFGRGDFDKYVFCSRIVTFGIPAAYQDNSSWDISDTFECHIGFKIILINNIERKVKVNVSNKVKNMPLGGLINIELNYSDIYTNDQSTGGIDVGVGNWNDDEINITI